MSVDIAEAWHHWPRYRDKIIARFCETDLYPIIEVYAREPPSDPHYSYTRGAWSLTGDPMPYFPWDHRAFTKSQALGTLILLDCLPPHIYDQIATCDTVSEKWKRLHQLYEVYQETTYGDGAASPVMQAVDDDGDEGAVLQGPLRVGVIATSDNTPVPPIKTQNRTFEKANDFILDKLRHYPTYGSEEHLTGANDPTSNPNPTVLEHITYMQILYEGLVQRNAQISEGEFISLIHATLKKLPAFQAFITALNAQAKNQGLRNVPIHALIEGIAEYETSVRKEKLAIILQEQREDKPLGSDVLFNSAFLNG